MSADGRPLIFSSPPDPLLNRAGFFERCWPGAGRGQEIDVLRLIEAGDEVVVTYGLKRPGTSRAGELTFRPEE